MNIVLMTVLAGWLAALTFVTLDVGGAKLSPALESGAAATVAFVHGDSIQASYAFIQDQEQELFKAVQQSQLALERAAIPLQEEAQELISYANGPGVGMDEIQIAQNRLYEIEAEMAEIQNRSQTQLMQMENDLQTQVATKLGAEVAIFAAQNGLDVVLNWGLSGEGVLYGAPSYDVTAELLAFLNVRHSEAQPELKSTEEETNE